VKPGAVDCTNCWLAFVFANGAPKRGNRSPKFFYVDGGGEKSIKKSIQLKIKIKI
jgi:hypothetical protein